MTAYILRRLLLIIPTLIGILTVNFFVIQAAPGGPVEQMINRLEGTGPALTSRISGAGSGEVARTFGLGKLRRPLPGRAGTRSRTRSPHREDVRLRSPPSRTLLPDAGRFSPVRFRRKLLSQHVGDFAHQGEDAGLRFPRPLEHPHSLCDFDPPGGDEGGEKRQPVRRLDLHPRGGGKRHPRLSFRHPPGHPLCRWFGSFPFSPFAD